MRRYPDKPVPAKPAVLKTLRDGEWLAQFKHDGWRAVIGWDGKRVSITTRTGKPIRAGSGLTAELRHLLAHTQSGTILDGEWLGRRRPEKGDPDPRLWRSLPEGEREELVLFDVLQIGDTWTGDLGALVRFRMLKLLWKHAGSGRGRRHLRLARGVTRGYARFFGASAKEPLCEGVVLKRVTSTVIGARDGSADNPQWIKVKHAKA